MFGVWERERLPWQCDRWCTLITVEMCLTLWPNYAQNQTQVVIAKENVWSPEMVCMMWLCCALIFHLSVYSTMCSAASWSTECVDTSCPVFKSINFRNKLKEAWLSVMWLTFQRHGAMLWCISSRFRVQCEGIIQCEPNGTLHIYCIR